MRRPVPRHHVLPLQRLVKPLLLCEPQDGASWPLIRQAFRALRLQDLHQSYDLVHSPGKMEHGSGPRFSGDFECGNIGNVYRIGIRRYEIHLLPDPSKWYSALWFMFKVENLTAGDYTFVIVGFFRDCHQHAIGVQPCAYSEMRSKDGFGWMRLGSNMNFWTFKRGAVPEFALSFTFTVTQTDNMHFAYLYPYSYSSLRNWLSENQLTTSVLCKTCGGVEVPAIFWDADERSFIDVLHVPRRRKMSDHPLVVIAARIHPGESNSSYAMEGLMERLFGSEFAVLKSFSWLLLPMLNPDGVICGYYRPTITGSDGNRVWRSNGCSEDPVAFNVTKLLDELVLSRRLTFILDFHGHTAQSNAFTYGVHNPQIPMNAFERTFPRLMGKLCHLFDEAESVSFQADEYLTTMRVALHHRYAVPFAYTLEMSFGAIEIGPERGKQMTPQHYKYIGQTTVTAIQTMIGSTPRSAAPANGFRRRYR